MSRSSAITPVGPRATTCSVLSGPFLKRRHENYWSALTNDRRTFLRRCLQQLRRAATTLAGRPFASCFVTRSHESKDQREEASQHAHGNHEPAQQAGAILVQWSDVLARAPCVKTHRPGTELRDNECATENRGVLHEHDHLHLHHHGIMHRPELVHYEGHGDEKQRNQ